MRAYEHFRLKNVGAGTTGVKPDGANAQWLRGGWYRLTAIATWGGGNLALQRLGPDGSTYLPVELTNDTTGAVAASLTANGSATVLLEPGNYQLVVTTATALYADLTRIPYTE